MFFVGVRAELRPARRAIPEGPLRVRAFGAVRQPLLGAQDRIRPRSVGAEPLDEHPGRL